MNELLRFDKKGKLRLSFNRQFDILDGIGDVAYRLALPPELSSVHNIFHISMLRKYLQDPSHVIDHQTLDVQLDLTYKETSMMILDRKIYVIRTKEIFLIKVPWHYHGVEGSSWKKMR